MSAHPKPLCLSTSRAMTQKSHKAQKAGKYITERKAMTKLN
jgi:hypothetical protein